MTDGVNPSASAVDGPVLVVGTGLIGTSVALALRRAEVEVLLSDVDPENLSIAQAAGAGRVLEDDDRPALVVVAVPPRFASRAIADASMRYPEATITDVTSVKQQVVQEAVASGADPARLVGGHPMAGREVSGAAGARKDVFDDRLWVVTPLPQSGIDHVIRVHRLVSACGAYPVEMSVEDHDAAVALVSHTPQVLSSVLAAQLVDAEDDHVRIAGQGLRDMTRIAGSNVAMWSDILAANAGPVADVLDGVIDELQDTVAALREMAFRDESARGTDAVAGVLRQGVEGQLRIPGKHGAAPSAFREINVMLEDSPGELARLVAAVGVARVNLEDIRIEHVLGRPSGLVSLFVRPEDTERLVRSLGVGDFDVRA